MPTACTTSPAAGIERFEYESFPSTLGEFGRSGGSVAAPADPRARSLLMLDYDGTLAPFHVDRFAATAYPGVEERLATLSGLAQVRLVLISGRPAHELRSLLPPRYQG